MYKSVVTALFLVLFLLANPVFADARFKNIADDERIVSALSVLSETKSDEVLDRIFKNKMKIIFYDLGMISFEYKNHYATVADDEFGQNYIIVNMKYRNEPKEAIAALLAHESYHQKKITDLDEEIGATLEEAKQWQKTLSLNPELANLKTPVAERLNSLVKLDKTGIANKISNNDFYRKQFKI